MFPFKNCTRFKCSMLHQYSKLLAGSIQPKNVILSQKAWLSYRCLKPFCHDCVYLRDAKFIRNTAVSTHTFLTQKLVQHPDELLRRRHLHTSSYVYGGASEVPRQSSAVSEAGAKVNLEQLTKVQELMTLQVKYSS